MKFQLEIECDNAAFGDDSETGSEVARILHDVGRFCHDAGLVREVGVERHTVRDINGNAVGSWSFGHE